MRICFHCVAFLSLLGLSAVAFAQPKINYPAEDKLGWKLACQAYTFGRNGVTCFDTLDILKDLGIKYVELFPGQTLSKEHNVKVGPGMSADDIKALKAKLAECGVTAVSFGVTGIPKDEPGARKLFDWAKTMGLLNIVAEPAADQFTLIDKLCKEYNIKVACHNHPNPSPYWDPQVVLDRTKGCSDMVGSCSDTGHWARSGLVPLDCLKKLKGKIIELHFKDLNEMGKGAHDVPWGTGVCNVKGMLQELKAQGFKGVFSIEYEIGRGDELKTNVGKCVQNFSDFCTELAKD